MQLISRDGNPAFESFVAQASNGRNSLPRILIGTLIIVAIWLGGTMALLAAGSAALSLGCIPGGWIVSTGDHFSDFFYSRVGLATGVLTIGAIWPGVWIAARLLHRRRLKTLLGNEARIARGDFWHAAVLTLVIAAVASLPAFLDPRLTRTDLPLETWLLALPAMTTILLIQTSAEELLFRGYLLQSLAARFRSPWIWAILPALLFAVIHWVPDAQWWMNGLVVISILVFALAAVFLVYRTGNLGAAMGMHFANNLVAFLFVSGSVPEEALSLYATPPIEDPLWTMTDAVIGGLIQVAMTAVILTLLLWRRSPFRVYGTRADKVRQGALVSPAE